MILIVDDKSENLFSLKTLLELHRYAVDTAPSGEEALKKILKNDYHLIVLDVQMPEMDGYEVAEAAQGYSKAKDIPIIFLSAVNTNKKFITKGYTSGAIDYITKPFDPDILLLKVQTLYRLSQQTKDLQEAQKALQAEVEARKATQVKLLQNVQELKSILESLPQIAFTVSAKGEIEYVNELWYNYSSEKKVFPATDTAETSVAGCVQTALKKKEAYACELHLKPLSGSDFRYHRLSLTPITNERIIVKWIGIFTDIHEQKMLNKVLEERVAARTEALQQSNTELERSNTDLQQYASVASHDLKEPIRKIQYFSNVLKDRYLTGNDDATAVITKIIRSSERMSHLIDDLLDHSLLSQQKAFEWSDTIEILKGVLSDLEFAVEEKAATVTYSGLPVMEVMPGRMRQVFQNIISNALKFSKREEPPQIHVQAEMVAEKSFDADADSAGNYCRITITDNGIGFRQEYADKIFTLFQRLNAREEYEGMGIGLAIVKKIVEQHHGLIKANSTEGAGTSFILLLPLKQSVHAPQTTLA